MGEQIDVEACERLKWLADACDLEGLDNLPVVSRANAQAFAADVRAVLSAQERADRAEARAEELQAEVEREREWRRNAGARRDTMQVQRDEQTAARQVAEAQVASLKAALEKIARDGSCPNGDVHLQRIARQALAAIEGGQS